MHGAVSGREGPPTCTVKPEMSPCLQAVTHCSKLLWMHFQDMSSSSENPVQLLLLYSQTCNPVRVITRLARHGGCDCPSRLGFHAGCAKNTRMPSPQGHLLTPRQQLWDSIERGAALAECEALLKADTELLNSPSEVCSLHLFSHTALDTPLLL